MKRKIAVLAAKSSSSASSKNYTALVGQALATPNSQQKSILEQWYQHMVDYGATHCWNLYNDYKSNAVDIDSTYYDASLVYENISALTKNKAWDTCRNLALYAYRDTYVLDNRGEIPGYWNFTGGIALHAKLTNSQASKDAVILMSTHAAFAGDSTPAKSTESFVLSREVAYTLYSYLDAESLGVSRNPRRDLLVNQALGHLDQWFGSRSASYTRSFMVGLTLRSLIRHYELTKDARIPPAIVRALDGLWSKNWVESEMAFRYQDVPLPASERFYDGFGRLLDGTEAAPDLNLLISPAYAWAGRHFGDQRFFDRADKIFEGGVRESFLRGGKQFNQSYLWSFDHVRWRWG